MLYTVGLASLALLPFALAQTSNDFESGWDQTTWPIYAPSCNQGGTVNLTDSKAHSGSYSMEVTSPGGYCGHIFFGTTAVPSGDVYVRVWVNADDALTSDHVSFIVMPDSSQPAGDDLRMGGQDSILMYNRESDDATMPDMSPQGTAESVPLPTDSWQCLEYHIGTNGTIETWLNSEAIPGLTIYPGVPNDAATQFQASTYIPKITGVYFGWESYGGEPNTFYYDDVSVQSSRIGCAVTGVASTTGASSATSSASTPPASSSTSATSSATSSVPSCAAVAMYGQCGGTGFSGCTVCASGATCTTSNPYYSQCLPA